MALIGGIIIQVVMARLDLDVLIIRRLQERIAGVALDLLVVTALASINLAVLGANIGVFLTLIDRRYSVECSGFCLSRSAYFARILVRARDR